MAATKNFVIYAVDTGEIVYQVEADFTDPDIDYAPEGCAVMQHPSMSDTYTKKVEIVDGVPTVVDAPNPNLPITIGS